MSTKFLELFIVSITLEKETVTKILGLFIDEKIIWKDHINTITAKISESIDVGYTARLITFPLYIFI